MTADTGERVEPVAGGRTALLAVAAGLAVYGLATYGFLAAAGRGLAASDFTPLSVMWTLLNAVGIGLFVPFEQEMARRTAVARISHESNVPALRHSVAGASGVVAVVAVVGLLLAHVLAARLFAGRTALVGLLVAAMAGMAVSYAKP